MTHALTIRLKYFWTKILPTPSRLSDETRFERDPLSHPDIARMSERERADLPFCPARVRPE
ncbi:MAG: hypothetical protein R8F89_13915 [Roseobacter sp.]|nr:hypothetical protein [Roseobacter sp.]